MDERVKSDDVRRFAVALSYPSEWRQYVEDVDAELCSIFDGEHVFFYKRFEAILARANLDTYLQKIYHDQSDLVVVFLCAEYECKEWCGLEWRAIRDLIKRRRTDEVMLVRFDNSDIKGTFSTDGFVNVNERPPKEIASLIRQRWEANHTHKNENNNSTIPHQGIQTETDEGHDLIRRLKNCPATGNSPEIAFAFKCLAEQSDEVRQIAWHTVRSIGWENILIAAENVAHDNNTESVEGIFDGLGACPAELPVMDVFNHLINALSGNLRNKAILLAERKRLSVELTALSGLFSEKGSAYEITKILGQGLIAASYKAQHMRSGLQAVVRVLRPELAVQPRIRTRFLDLASQSMRYLHEHLVVTRDTNHFQNEGIFYYVRDYVKGRDLKTVLDDGQVFRPGEILEMMRQLTLALAVVHKGKGVHMGVRPSNIFVVDSASFTLGDPSLPPPLLVALERLAYDCRYVAPELFNLAGAMDVAAPVSDFYSLGCVMYELACGEPPFVSDTSFELAALHVRGGIIPPSKKGSQLGELGNRLLSHLLRCNPHDRPQSCDEVLREIDQAWRGLNQQEKTVGDIEYSKSAHIERSIASPRTLWSRVFISEFAGDKAKESTGKKEVEGLPQIEGYRVIDLLGEGGMGSVWRAVQLSTQRQVAIKTLRQFISHSSKAQVRFEREVNLAAGLSHPNIARIYDAGFHGGIAFYAMELIEGQRLDKYVLDSHLSQRQILQLIHRVVTAVAYAHRRGIIHRDLKPSNLLVDQKGQPYILDFGLAKDIRKGSLSDLSISGDLIGTLTYMAPEQAAGQNGKVDARTDVYALGVILYQLLTGHFPYDLSGPTYETLRCIANERARRPRDIDKHIDSELEALLLKALEKQPEDRYITASELAFDIENYLSARPLMAGPTSSMYLLRKYIVMNRSRVIVCIVIITLLVLLAVMFALYVQK